MRFHTRRVVPTGILALALALLSLPGCGGAGGEGEVKGKVYYGNEPLSAAGLDQAQVHFHKIGDANDAFQVFSGKFDDQGNYAVKAPPGKYKITVTATKMPKDKGAKGEISYAVPDSMIPKVYTDPKTTDKILEVKAGGGSGGEYDIKLAKASGKG